MRKILSIILLPCLLVILASRASLSQVFYKWVDEKGVAHFTDDITQVPEKSQRKVESIETTQETEEPKVGGESTPAKREEASRDQLGRGEDYWRGRVEEWRKKLGQQQEKLTALRAKYNDLTEKHNDSRSIVQRTGLRKERDQVKKEIDECNAQIEEARAMVDKKIPEEAELYKAKPEWTK